MIFNQYIFHESIDNDEILNIFKFLGHNNVYNLNFGYGESQIKNYLHKRGFKIKNLKIDREELIC